MHQFVLTIGFFAAALTTFCQIPQLLKILKTHHTKDISFPTYTTLGIGVLLWFIYGFFVQDAAIIGANFLTFLIVLWIWILKLRYG